jgi:hypothetical protein
MEVTLAITLQAPNTVEQYSIGKYSLVTKKQRLRALETPILVMIKLMRITDWWSGGVNARTAPDRPPMIYANKRVGLVPK